MFLLKILGINIEHCCNSSYMLLLKVLVIVLPDSNFECCYHTVIVLLKVLLELILNIAMIYAFTKNTTHIEHSYLIPGMFFYYSGVLSVLSIAMIYAFTTIILIIEYYVLPSYDSNNIEHCYRNVFLPIEQ